MQLVEDTLRLVFACRGPICIYIIHVSLFMSLSCPYPCPFAYLSTHLSATHIQSYHLTICFLWASESFDADHRGKCSLCSWDFCAKTEADNGLWTYYPPLSLPSNGWYLMGYHVLVLQSGLLLGWKKIGHI